MSDYSDNPARPVSLFTIGFLLVLFAAFLFVVKKFYAPAEAAPFNSAAANLPKDKSLDWRATQEARRVTLTQVREEQQKTATTYGWANKDAKVVRLPIDPAIKLTVKDYAKK